MEGTARSTASPSRSAFIMGHDLVAVDATCCRLMMLVVGAMKKLGRMKEAEIPQLGESIAALRADDADLEEDADAAVGVSIDRFSPRA